MYILEIPYNTVNYVAWQNLVDYAYDLSDWTGAPQIIAAELQKLNGHVLRGDRSIRFETENDAMLFVLTWA